MELTKALGILKERMETNEVILNDKSYESDFDRFVRVENEAIEVVLDYFKNRVVGGKWKIWINI